MGERQEVWCARRTAYEPAEADVRIVDELRVECVACEGDEEVGGSHGGEQVGLAKEFYEVTDRVRIAQEATHADLATRSTTSGGGVALRREENDDERVEQLQARRNAERQAGPVLRAEHAADGEG